MKKKKPRLIDEEIQKAADAFVAKIGPQEAEKLLDNLKYTRIACDPLTAINLALLKATRYSGIRYYGKL